MAEDLKGEPFKVAIIGAGMGGATTAYYLRQLFGPQVGITLFEQSGRIGGRIRAISYGGSVCETGASIFISDNKYMASFVKKFGLELDNKQFKTSRLAFFNGEKPFVFSTLENCGFMERLRLLSRYGLELVRLGRRVRTFISYFAEIYTMQQHDRHFTTPAELLQALSPEFVEMTQWEHGDWLEKRDRVSNGLREELLYGLVSNNYCQNFDVHAFVGHVTMATLVGKLNSVKGGNQQIPECLINSALAENPKGSPKEFVHAQVTTIAPTTDGRYELAYCPPENVTPMKESFDYVVIAAPLHQESSIRASGGLTLPSDKYCAMNRTLFTGDLKHSTFGVTTSKLRKSICPTILPTRTGYMKQHCQFRSLDALLDPNRDATIWSAFTEQSRVPFPEQTIAAHYLELSNTEKPVTFTWLAYPIYQALPKPMEQLGSFVLARRLYYPNAIERVASCMEMAAISGRNVALLIAADRKVNTRLRM